MAHTLQWYQLGLKYALEAGNLTSDTLKVALMSNGYTPNLQTHQYMDEAGANDPIDEEINAGGGDTNGYYAGHGQTGRKTLANVTLAANAAGLILDADDITWTALGAALEDITYAIIHWPGPTDDTDARLLAIYTFSPIFDPNGNDFQLSFSTSGIAKMGRGTLL